MADVKSVTSCMQRWCHSPDWNYAFQTAGLHRLKWVFARVGIWWMLFLLWFFFLLSFLNFNVLSARSVLFYLEESIVRLSWISHECFLQVFGRKSFIPINFPDRRCRFFLWQALLFCLKKFFVFNAFSFVFE